MERDIKVNQLNVKTLAKVICKLLLLLQFSPIGYAYLTSQTVQIIHGMRPSLSTEIENNIDDLDLFGLNVDDLNYYGSEVDTIPLQTSYPFKDKFKIAPIKQPNENQYYDNDGDQLDFLSAKDKINMTWYYTNAKNQLVEFIPTATDTFCSLSQKGMYSPYKVKLTADLLLFSKFGIPDDNEYPNDTFITQPSKMYTVLEDTGFCYAKPELTPSTAANSAKNQWNKNFGFLIQSNVDLDKNFPTTGFYGAKFDLLLAQNGLANNYDWSVKQGSELATITNNNDIVTVYLNTPIARDSKQAWQYVEALGSDGFTIIIEGKNKNTHKSIRYGFKIKKWYEAWKQAQDSKGNVIGVRDTAEAVAAECRNKPGNYRITEPKELSNAPYGNRAGSSDYTREIGSLFGEWGDPSQDKYPGSYGPAKNQSNIFSRWYVWDPEAIDAHTHQPGTFCDMHTYNAKYHCRANENEDKNGVCVSIPPGQEW